MAGDEPEIGDKVSWNWGGGAPGGTVAEKKTDGEITIKSKRGNTIKKNASKDNPGVHISRSGNDVVKRVSELNVENKGGGGKRKREYEEEKENKKEDDIEKNDEGKDVRADGKKAKKEDKDDKEEKEDAKPKANEKKAGRPKGPSGGAAKKEKKPSKPRNTEGVSGRTRSQKK